MQGQFQALLPLRSFLHPWDLAALGENICSRGLLLRGKQMPVRQIQVQHHRRPAFLKWHRRHLSGNGLENCLNNLKLCHSRAKFQLRFGRLVLLRESGLSHSDLMRAAAFLLQQLLAYQHLCSYKAAGGLNCPLQLYRGQASQVSRFLLLQGKMLQYFQARPVQQLKLWKVLSYPARLFQFLEELIVVNIAAPRLPQAETLLLRAAFRAAHSHRSHRSFVTVFV